jgi:hypothetical protein
MFPSNLKLRILLHVELAIDALVLKFDATLFNHVLGAVVNKWTVLTIV